MNLKEQATPIFAVVRQGISFLFWNIFADWLVIVEKSSTFAAQMMVIGWFKDHRDARESGESPELYLQL